MGHEPRHNDIVAGIEGQVWIRTAVIGDIDKLCAYYGTLSRDSRYNRFMGAVTNFSKLAFDCLMQVRRAECFTLVAEWREQGCDAIIGEASYAFDLTRRRGEFAISVADRWQRQGLGTAPTVRGDGRRTSNDRGRPPATATRACGVAAEVVRPPERL